MQGEEDAPRAGGDIRARDRAGRQERALGLREIERAAGRVFELVELVVGVGRRHLDDGEPVRTAVHHLKHPGRERVLECVELVRDLAGRYDVRELVYDPWRFGQAAQELDREGLTVVAFPQHDARMIPASARLHAAIVERRLVVPDDPQLARHAADAIARHSRRGWRIDKPNPRTNIDAIIALAMAVERAEHREPPLELIGWL